MTEKTFRDREILSKAHQRGPIATLGAFFRLSGPGWLQSAITLGGGSLIGALYLGMLGGTSMLWLQLVAIVIGVIMLSAISYVTLSTNKRPYGAINEYINPVLGVGWITGTMLANMIWIIPQFALCYDALDENLVPGGLSDGTTMEMVISGVLAACALTMVMLSFNPGWMSKTFDWVLKLIVGMIVICFIAVVYYLATTDALNWTQILMGFIPNFTHWTTPAPAIESLLTNLEGSEAKFWKDQIIAKQQSSMIGVTATAVGLNMTFLLPYSMLARSWDKPFRGLARFDLVTAMAIPYLLVTTCIVIASAHAFHGKADPNFLSDDPAVMQQSVLFASTVGVLENRYLMDEGPEKIDERKQQLNSEVSEIEARLSQQGLEKDTRQAIEDELAEATERKHKVLATFGASLSEDEKRIAPTLVKPNAAQLATTLKPLLGERYEKYADLIFGLGAFGMGFSTIIILSLINGYAFAEIAGRYDSFWIRTAGALAAIAVGFCWFWFGQGESRTWLGIVASTFGAILLPIAYICFFALMNNSRLLGEEKPTGIRMPIWNFLMAIGVIGAVVQAYGAISTKVGDPTQGPFVIGGVAVFLLLAVIGFSARPRHNES